MSFGSVGDWLSVGAAPFTGGASLLASPTIRGGLSDAASSIGSNLPGKNTTRAPTFGETPQYDPHKFEYGGRPSGASDDAFRYRSATEQAQGRQAPQADFSNARPDYNYAAQWGNHVGADRTAQAQAAGLMMNRAQGLTPSLAQMQADRQMQQATAAQASMAASARGPAGLALAQQNAANNLAGAQGAISNQAQINAANERMLAEQSAFGAYSGIRQGDTGMVNDEAQRAQYGATLASDQQRFNAQQRLQQGQFNDAYGLGMTNAERGVRSDELMGGVQQQRTLAGSLDTQQQLLDRQGQANADREFDYLKMGLGAIEGKASAGATPKAAGGPVRAGGLYLVGERGPELMVAPRDGHIVPNHMIRGLY